MAFFNDLTASLKQKWLQFFQNNRSWINRYVEVESVYTPDGGRRPPSYLILGVINTLEPQLAELMLPFSKLNSDVDSLIDVLDLNFDPDLFLGNRFNSAGPSVDEELIDDAVIVSLTDLTTDDFNDMSLNQMSDNSTVIETENDSTFRFVDEMGSGSGLETMPATEATQSENRSADAWGQENSSDTQTSNQNQSDHDQDIYRIFPNS